MEKGRLQDELEAVLSEVLAPFVGKTVEEGTREAIFEAVINALGDWELRQVMIQRQGWMLRRTEKSTDLLLDPYDWGPEGIPKGKPFRYDPVKGYVFDEEDQDG